MNRKDIRLSQPRQDCRFVQIHNFGDIRGNKCEAKYALCINQKKTSGCVSIDIAQNPVPFAWETSCINCKLFESANQLSLFNETQNL